MDKYTWVNLPIKTL